MSLQSFFHRFVPIRLFFPEIQDIVTHHTLDQKEWIHQLLQYLTCHHEKNQTFSLSVQESTIAKAGRGVFLKGKVKAGSIVTLYPGTVYQPGEPLLFCSFNNHYILRCYDGIYVDGKGHGLSKRIYKAMYRFHHAQNQMFYPSESLCSDLSWTELTNTCALGHIINNGTSTNANVHYHEINIPCQFPMHLRKWIPNIPYNRNWKIEEEELRTVALIAIRDLENEELLSSYHQMVRTT